MNIIKSLPEIPYRGIVMSNLLVSANLVKNALNRFDIYYPYLIKEKERADTIAYDYYGNSQYDWLIYLTNKIHDPYHGWPLSNKELVEYVIKKYGGLEEANQTIAYYKYVPVEGDNMLDVENRTYLMTQTTFDNLTNIERVGWVPVTAFENEQQENESKREIRLLSNQFLSQIDEEMTNLFR